MYLYIRKVCVLAAHINDEYGVSIYIAPNKKQSETLAGLMSRQRHHDAIALRAKIKTPKKGKIGNSNIPHGYSLRRI